MPRRIVKKGPSYLLKCVFCGERQASADDLVEVRWMTPRLLSINNSVGVGADLNKQRPRMYEIAELTQSSLTFTRDPGARTCIYLLSRVLKGSLLTDEAALLSIKVCTAWWGPRDA